MSKIYFGYNAGYTAAALFHSHGKDILWLGENKIAKRYKTRLAKAQGLWTHGWKQCCSTSSAKQWLWEQGVPNMRLQWIDLHDPAPVTAGIQQSGNPLVW